jgi:hypothetical protein
MAHGCFYATGKMYTIPDGAAGNFVAVYSVFNLKDPAKT